MLRLKINLILLLCVTAVQLQAQTAGYKYKRPLSRTNKTWQVSKLPVELLSQAQQDFGDLRIFGIKGKDTIEVPYLLRQRSDQVTLKEFPFAQINESSGDGGHYFTFQSPETNASVINQIKLEFKQDNFDWKVLLEGSNDDRSWFTISRNYRILSIKNTGTDYQFTTLNFPDSKYQYYRISLQSPEKPDLRSAKIARADTVKGVYHTVKPRAMEIKNDRETKETIINLDLNGLVPVSLVRIQVNSTFDFYRNFRIEYATDSVQTDKGMQYNYTNLYSGILTSLEKTEFSFSNTIAARLRVVIENNDNAPLQIGQVLLKGNTFELTARFDYFSYNYSLYYGNANVSSPNYEITKFEDKIPSILDTADVGNEQNNPSYTVKTSKPLFENKIWLWALMTIIMIILGGFSYKMLKS
ncbi:MAG: DUF3999 family protein [Bacteroidota bacterium]